MDIGADGLKAGDVGDGGFGLVGSAVQDGQRLIVVMYGLKSATERVEEARKLFDYGFHSFDRRTLYRGRRDGRRRRRSMAARRARSRWSASVRSRSSCRAAKATSWSPRSSMPARSRRRSQGAGRGAAQDLAGRHAGRRRAAEDRRRRRARGPDAARVRRRGRARGRCGAGCDAAEARNDRAQPRGRFITLEGGEGAGKSVQAKRLEEKLASHSGSRSCARASRAARRTPRSCAR